MDNLQSQIHEGCRLALPEGLKELMSDISREVLRAQPENIYQFIANYLEALLEVRETLAIACHICNDVCNCTSECGQELYDELMKIGLVDEDLHNAMEIIQHHLNVGQESSDIVKEQSLLLKLLRKTSIDEANLPKVQQAIQRSFKKRHLRHENHSQNESKETTDAVQHTLYLYQKNHPDLRNETEEIFIAPEFKPIVTTVSSTSLAGSYVQLPRLKPYSAHDSEILSAIPEKEYLSIGHTVATADAAIHEEEFVISEKPTNIDEVKNKEVIGVLFYDCNDIIQENYDNEIDEAIENAESENESTTSSIAEVIQNSNVNHELDII